MCDLCVTECGWGPHFLKYWKYNHKLQPGASNYTDTMVYTYVAKYHETLIPATHCTLLPQITMLHECFSGVWLEKYDSCWIIIAKMYSTIPLNNLVKQTNIKSKFRASRSHARIQSGYAVLWSWVPTLSNICTNIFRHCKWVRTTRIAIAHDLM